MSLRKIRKIEGSAVPIIGDDLDTDQIAPALYLKVVSFDGLAKVLFRDSRFDQNGKSKGHTLDDPRFQNANIIVTGRNFGCGSSREHAPQSIGRAGFEAIIAESFGEIFFANCTTLGIPCVTLTKTELNELHQIIEETPTAQIQIDLADCSLSVADTLLLSAARCYPDDSGNFLGC